MIKQESKAKYLEEIRQLSVDKESTTQPVGIRPDRTDLEACQQALANSAPEKGLGLDETFRFLVDKVLPACSNQSTKHYYGFVTGGVTPAASLADNLVTLADQNCGVHLPDDSISSQVENNALLMLLDLLKLDADQFKGRVLTTGATASNTLALACAREGVLSKALQAKGLDPVANGPAELGIFGSMKKAGLEDVQIVACDCHSSLVKAASVVGLGRSSVKAAPHVSKPWDFDLSELERFLSQEGVASIVAVNFGEVNTGLFTTRVQQIRELCDKYNAWMHIDGAFSIFLRALMGSDSPIAKFASQNCSGLELADSITGDNHKTLNVPYDCGFFFTRDVELMEQVFKNAGAAYLKTSAATSPGSIKSWSNIGLENSRRFRALPVYATLVAYGKSGYRNMLENLVNHTRAIASYIDSSKHYELLPRGVRPDELSTIVLFKANDDAVNAKLKQLINDDNRIYVSGTEYDGSIAVRIAPCNWQVQPGDEKLVIEVLESLVTR
ncbi:hypothetical protein TRVA0_027S01662 [Trichomonascus vanleenenianus]|uniref:pyridoxal phosphate-dependent decarboxylase family protein n=1 Tax=Trichomonascus vanleenenianus TaxID=2268995 RepID=UPI003ECA7C66